MARNTTIANLTSAIRASFQKRSGQNLLAANTANSPQLPGWANDNTFELRWRNAANTDDARVLSVDGSNNIQLGEQVFTPSRRTLKFNLTTTASLVTQHFVIIPAACRIVGITEIHATAESTATTLTAYIEKLTGTTAPGSGTTLMSGTFNLKATAQTLQTATLTTTGTADSDAPDLQCAAGDRLGIKFSTTATELVGVCISITVAPSGTGEWVTYNLQANGDLVDQAFYLAQRDVIVTAAYYVHSTKCSVASTVVQVVKDTSTNAPGAGTDILTNNTNTGFDLTGANNTVQTGTLTATAATLRLAPGDRLSVDFAGTLTALAGVIVVVVLQPVSTSRKEVLFALSKNANLVDQQFFIADRNYKIVDAAAVWSVAAASGNVQLTRDKTTDAPGAGTDLLSMDTNAGWQVDGTANTPEVATWKDTRFNYLLAGDRLSLDMAVGISLAGLVVNVGLEPA